MAFHVRDAQTDELVRRLARKESVGVTEAVKLAVSEALERRAGEREEVLAAIREIQDRVASYGKSGLEADKAFYDWLSDEEG